MKFRYRSSVIVMAIIAFTAATSVAPVSPASAKDYELLPNTWSPVLRAAQCKYRVTYGTFGSAPYAFMRIYGSTCGGLNPIHVLWTDGHTRELGGVTRLIHERARDECFNNYGEYQEWGGAYHVVGFGVGMMVTLGAAGVTNRFLNVPALPDVRGSYCR